MLLDNMPVWLLAAVANLLIISRLGFFFLDVLQQQQQQQRVTQQIMRPVHTRMGIGTPIPTYST